MRLCQDVAERRRTSRNKKRLCSVRDDRRNNTVTRRSMKICAGYDIAFTVPQPTPIILMLKVHPTRANDLLTPDDLVIVPSVGWREYTDVFGNICTRIVAPAG